jgi:hypothetical protein
MKAVKPDPVFALIDAHKVARASWLKVVDEYTPIEQKVLAQGLYPSQCEDSHPLMIAYNKRCDATRDAMLRALRKLLKQKPTTTDGLAAVALHLIEVWNIRRKGRGVELQVPTGDWLEVYLRTVAAAAERIGAKRSAQVLPFKRAA